MKTSLFLLLLSSFILFNGCGSEDNPGTSDDHTDISGEFEGVLQLASGPQKGIVLYKFVSKGDNVYTGFYEGIEFAEVTVNGNTISGTPSNGNNAFSTMIGEIDGNRIFYTFFNEQGNIEASFSGSIITPGTRLTPDITIDGAGYVQIDDPLSQCTFTSGQMYYYRVGDLDWKASFLIICGENISAGTYPIGPGLFDATISVVLFYQGESFDSSTGSVVVTGDTDSSLSYDLSNVQWEQSIDGTVAPSISGKPICIY